MGLSGAGVIVTGATRGIGRAITEAFVGEGASVVAVARNVDDLAELERASGGAVVGVAGSVRDAEVRANAVQTAIDQFGRLDVLVNNAAINPYFGELMGISDEQMAATAEANQSGMVAWTRQAWQAWMHEHGGAVVNVASIGGLITEPNLGFYNATKAAMLHLTRQLAAELGPLVRVNAVAPGLVRTTMSAMLVDRHEDDGGDASVPLGRLGEPHDIAPAVLFLAGAASGWTTGATLCVDGGMALRR